MFERFTEHAIKVIMLAQEEGRKMGHNFVGTEQILLGITRLGTGVSSDALSSMGVTIDRLRMEVEKIIGRGSGLVAIEIPFTPRAKRALELSWQSARELDVNFIDVEHLLLGLLAEKESVALNVLNAMEISIDELRSKLLAGVGKSAPARAFMIGFRPGLNDVSLAVSALSSVSETLSNLHRDLEALKSGREIAIDEDVSSGLNRLRTELQKLDALLLKDWSEVREKISMVQSDITTLMTE